MNAKILGIGATGLVGSRVTKLLEEFYSFDNLSIETGFDIRKPELVHEKIANDKIHSIVILFAAKTDVDGCENDKKIDKEILKKDEEERSKFFQNNSTAWSINVYGTQNVVNACKKLNKKLIYISTDFVFNGKNPPAGGYKEESPVSPVDWYGLTKLEGERIVEKSGIKNLIVRISFPFRLDEFSLKKDFLHVFIRLLEKREPFRVVSDALITPTFIDDIAYALKALVDNEKEGIYHVVGSQSLSAYQAVVLLADKLGFNKSLVGENNSKDFYKGRAARPYHGILNNDKIEALGVKMQRFNEVISQLKL